MSFFLFQVGMLRVEQKKSLPATLFSEQGINSSNSSNQQISDLGVKQWTRDCVTFFNGEFFREKFGKNPPPPPTKKKMMPCHAPKQTNDPQKTPQQKHP